MVFNWFRRQFTGNEASQQETESEETQIENKETTEEQLEVKPEELATTPQPNQEVAGDYLTWAKAAYKNIQQKQQGQTETTPLPTEAAADSSLEIGIEANTTAILETAEITTETEIEEATVVSETVDSSAVAPITNESTDIAEENSALEANNESELTQPTAVILEDDSASLPIWAREDRQARLEKLKASAIEESEPVNIQANTSTVVEKEAGELPFDEGFLWSAQVLAAQGRRAEDVSIEEISWLKRLRQGLDKTRRGLINQLKAIVGQGPLNQDAVMAIEALLLQADVGVEGTDRIISLLQQKLRQEVLPPEQAIAYLKQILRDILEEPFTKGYAPTFAPEKDTLNIWLMTGVNGAGKTTTIGKIAHLSQKSGYNCLIGAADTFRAAAVEQVKIWGQRSGIEVIANPGKNTDPAAVVFDAITAAKARDTELLLIDTAGRLQNKKNLMDELSKIRRIIDKKAPEAKVESLLVLDSTLGQNGLSQAKVFSEAAKLSGVVLTKLDGTAKGGVALAVVQQLGLPIRFIGAGEGVEDLRPFSSYEFVEALLSG